jgi:hypothetical protein
MFRITEDPSSGSLYKNDSIVSVDMDKVGVMAAYCDPLCTRVVHCTWNVSEHFQIFYNFNCIYVLYIVHQLDSKVFNNKPYYASYIVITQLYFQ